MKVSICVRVKYPIDRLLSMILCLKRQTHEDWEAIIVTDGLNEPAKRLVYQIGDPRLVFIETAEKLGFWGHPYRNLGIAKCTGELIGLTNDDNYYVPTYFQEMVDALTSLKTKMVMCHMIHKDFGYAEAHARPAATQCDLGNWLVDAEIAKSTSWPGNDLLDDGRYVEQIAAKAGLVALVQKPLFIKN